MAIEYSEESQCYIWIDHLGSITDTDNDPLVLAQRHGVTLGDCDHRNPETSTESTP